MVNAHEPAPVQTTSVRNAPLTRVPDPDTNTILLHTGDAVPFPVDVAGPPMSSDEEVPVYLGAAVIDYGEVIMPCKIVLLSGAPKVLYREYGSEVQHKGYYYLLCLDDRHMHWISSSLVSKPFIVVVGGWKSGNRVYASSYRPDGKLEVYAAWYSSYRKVSGNNRHPINVHRLVRLTIALPGICAFRI